MAPKAAGFQYVTGFCQNGFHEGLRRRNYRGEPMAFCRGRWSTHLHGSHTEHSCGCGCHETMTSVVALDRKIVSRILKGVENEMEHDFLAEMCGVKVELIESIASMTETISAMDWEPGQRTWPETGKWWRHDDEGVQPVEPFVRPWTEEVGIGKASRESEVVIVKSANALEDELEEKGELTADQRRVRKAIKLGLLPPNPNYVDPGKHKTHSSVDEKEFVAASLRERGLTMRDDVNLAGDPDASESKNVRVAGQLEREVKYVCDLFILGLMPEVDRLTVSEIALQVNVDNPPSTGAITNVLKRWSEVGFAVHETGPHRFGGYTSKGIELGVSELYAQVGRSERGAAIKARHSFHKRP